MTIGIDAFIFLSALLFAIGFGGVLLRKNTLVIYMCLELMLVASTLAFFSTPACSIAAELGAAP